MHPLFWPSLNIIDIGIAHHHHSQLGSNLHDNITVQLVTQVKLELQHKLTGTPLVFIDVSAISLR